jgi:hypothetical protein
MRYDDVEDLRQHAAWRLLRADNAPLVLSFVGRVFSEENSATLPLAELVSRLAPRMRSRTRRPNIARASMYGNSLPTATTSSSCRRQPLTRSIPIHPGPRRGRGGQGCHRWKTRMRPSTVFHAPRSWLQELPHAAHAASCLQTAHSTSVPRRSTPLPRSVVTRVCDAVAGNPAPGRPAAVSARRFGEERSSTVDTEAALASTERSLDATLRSATALVRELKRALGAARNGHVRDLRKSLAPRATRPTRWPATPAGSPTASAWTSRLTCPRAGTSRTDDRGGGAGLSIVEDDDRLLRYPSLLRILPGNAAVEVDKVRDRRLRASLLVSALARAQDRGPRFKARRSSTASVRRTSCSGRAPASAPTP